MVVGGRRATLYMMPCDSESTTSFFFLVQYVDLRLIFLCDELCLVYPYGSFDTYT